MNDQSDMFSPQFDIERARALRDEGIAAVAENNESFLREARRLARLIAEITGTVTCDDVRGVCMLDPHHHNAWGAVFKHKDFEWTGQYRQSKVVQGHGNMQRIWRLKQ